jgi:predicted acetyltransferase
MPGCTQIGVSHGVFSRERNSGMAVAANRERCKAMLEMGYDYTLCTVDASNIAQVKVLDRNGWKFLSAFKSSKTNHVVHLYGKALWI